jgi:hypothetical protein
MEYQIGDNASRDLPAFDELDPRQLYDFMRQFFGVGQEGVVKVIQSDADAIAIVREVYEAVPGQLSGTEQRKLVERLESRVRAIAEERRSHDLGSGGYSRSR